MISDNLGKVLHDKATRGLSLSDEEQAQLQAWYDEQDAQEANLLASAPGISGVSRLQAQIDTTLVQLMSMTRRIQEVMSENNALRQEIEGLRHQLVTSIPLKKTA
ncbi:hypothetical protein [Thiothrix nivea]|uniref:Uncharacterized protein n=1 Tax=Thiothrix nivea (strain ATCC 35100 / DSM 5205 / JP2) TaxID=870187 RepID=A0A656H8Q2_THINJ|nr:hypothetical protein [Thiothrix nivea]EIJ33021.1 hypothetical protein Thini_0367 [Thiothrix nivea DSM 5205]